MMLLPRRLLTRCLLLLFAIVSPLPHSCRTQLRNRPDTRYMDTIQRDINPTMRGILVDWLVEVAEEYKLLSDTLYLSANYIDRVLSSMSVVRSELQLVGVTCMLVAAKYEEIYAPQVEEFCYITDNTYTRTQVVDMERKILDTLRFELTVPTTKTFLRRFLTAAPSSSSSHRRLPRRPSSSLSSRSTSSSGRRRWCTTRGTSRATSGSASRR